MARYIDADDLLNALKEERKNGNFVFTSKWIKEIMDKIPTADVVPKSEEGAECPTCHGTGRIGTTDWLTKNITKEQLAKEKAEAIAEHEQHIKQDYASEIFAEIEENLNNLIRYYKEKREYVTEIEYSELEQRYCDIKIRTFEERLLKIAELKKKYTE